MKYSIYDPIICRSGTQYSVAGRQRVIPTDLAFLNEPKTRLMKRHVLETMCFMLKYVDQLLRENNIDYVISHGTLLGAVRHRGLIPWDDDMDLMIINSEDMQLIPNFKNRLERDGFALHKVNDYYKLSHKSLFMGYPYLDIYNGPGRNAMEDIYPIQRMPFEYFELSVPFQAVKVVENLYGNSPSALTHVVHDRVFSHRVTWLMLRLFGETIYNIAHIFSDFFKKTFKLEKCNP